MFGNIYKNKKILITGHTGFKGSWLTIWLILLGAKVIGFSKDIPTNPSMFTKLGLQKKIKHIKGNINNYDLLKKTIKTNKPNFIFHLAAQGIVSVSYKKPIETFYTNSIGTLNLLDILKDIKFVSTVIIITSDKCYDNQELKRGYKEDDRFGGKDIYSGSKGAAEIIYKSYFYSYLKSKKNIKSATARAGNVIGGGDWAKDRIVPDAMRAWSKKKPVKIRNPQSTRPWQHVLEPLSGYLRLGQMLNKDININGKSFNFGPKLKDSHRVEKLLHDLSLIWNLNNYFSLAGKNEFYEANLLQLNCNLALKILDWKPNLKYSDLIKFTGQWYFNFYSKNEGDYNFTVNQIKTYCKIASIRGISWSH